MGLDPNPNAVLEHGNVLDCILRTVDILSPILLSPPMYLLCPDAVNLLPSRSSSAYFMRPMCFSSRLPSPEVHPNPGSSTVAPFLVAFGVKSALARVERGRRQGDRGDVVCRKQTQEVVLQKR